MLPVSVRRFIGNVVGGFIYNHDKRLRTRIWVSAPMWRCMRFVRRRHKNLRSGDVRRFYGAGGKSLVLGVGNKCVYKFSCMHNANEIVLREKDVVDTFRMISPIPTPGVRVLPDGKNLIRRYDFMRGASLASLSPETVVANAETFGRQIAEFLFVIGLSDPDNLKKYKVHQNDIPRMFYGWNHMDFDNLENFLVDTKTMKISSVIDWENAEFGDFYNRLFRTHKQHKRILFDVVVREYKKLYLANIRG